MSIFKPYIFISLFLVALLYSNGVAAQANVWLGGGINFSKMRKVYANKPFSQEDNAQTGFNLAFTLAQPLSEKLNITSSASYDTKGYVTKINDDNNTTEDFKTHYLNFYPSSLQYYYTLSTQAQLYGTTGPYLGLGLFGKKEFYDDDGFIKEDFDWGKLELERFDIGWTFGLGYEYRQILQCDLSYDMGLKNITENSNTYLKLRNHTLKLSLKVSLSQVFTFVRQKEEHLPKKSGLSN